jgi:hypothetical protein
VSNAPVSPVLGAAPSRVVNPFVLQLPGFPARAARNARAMHSGSWESAGGTKQAVYVADPSLDGYFGAICYYAASGGSQLGCLTGGSSFEFWYRLSARHVDRRPQAFIRCQRQHRCGWVLRCGYEVYAAARRDIAADQYYFPAGVAIDKKRTLRGAVAANAPTGTRHESFIVTSCRCGSRRGRYRLCVQRYQLQKIWPLPVACFQPCQPHRDAQDPEALESVSYPSHGTHPKLADKAVALVIPT